MGGSGETLYRGIYKYNEPYAVTTFASLRMVADLSDDEKVVAVLPGGITARLFDPHFKNQVKPFLTGEKVYWWFSDKSIEAHAKYQLVLNPG